MTDLTTFEEFRDYLTSWDRSNELTRLGLEIAKKVTSPLYGVVVRAVNRTHDWDDAYTFSIGSTAAESRFTLGTSTNKYNGGGWIDETQTYLAAVGETIERYCGAYPHPQLLTRASYEELTKEGAEAVHPKEIALFHPQQFTRDEFRYRHFDEDTVVPWIRGFDLTSEAPVHYPAPYVLLSELSAPGEKPIGYSTSSGLASHSTPIEAILAGLLEQAERDAFTVAWYGNLTLPRIDPSSDDSLDRFWHRFIKPSGIDVELVNLSEINGFPTVAAVSVNRDTPVAPVAFGAASDLTLLDACKSAAVESLQTRNWVKAMQREGSELPTINDNLDKVIHSFEDHIKFYISPEAAEKTKFFYSGKLDSVSDDYNCPNYPSRLEVLDSLVRRAESQGGRVLTFDLTTPDIRGIGGHVYKTVIHGFQQLDCGYSRRFLGGSRLRTKPQELGFVKDPLPFESFNPWPHPFP